VLQSYPLKEISSRDLKERKKVENGFKGKEKGREWISKNYI